MFELKLSFESPVIVNVPDTSESYRVSERGARCPIVDRKDTIRQLQRQLPVAFQRFLIKILEIQLM
ncbi:hypothetical protein NIES2104_64880 [Leptolyngbya sp. NIES-2104]|nr:hypothetical protein NIES2104_64880 [Leptolyngbya sp. NIES-2104]